MINKKHLLVLIFFRNTEMDKMLVDEATSTQEIYDQAIARQMLNEKFLIQQELTESGILSLYTTPNNLSVDVINKYIEIKYQRLI
ncbi:MAG: hypothetical protein JXQ90_00835 [Cyclobacteriaceae bacterium]